MSYGEEHYSFQVVALHDNPSPAFQTVIDYWDSKCGEKFAPSWDSIDLMDLPPEILPNCMVVDIKDPIIETRYRFFGTGIVQLIGAEMTRQTLADIKSEAKLDHIINQYQHVVNARKPVIFLAAYMGQSGQKLCDLMLRLPLPDDMERVSNVISFEDFGDYSHDLQELYSVIDMDSN